MDDPEFGKLLKQFWQGEPTQKDRNTINKRVVTRTDIELPKNISSHVVWSYACPTNKECNAISKGVFKSHLMHTHPSVESDALPPENTIVIDGDFQTSTKNML